MSAIILNEEQMDSLRLAVGPVTVCDREGSILGTVDPDRSEELQRELDFIRVPDQQTYSSQHVTAMLQYLAKIWQKEGGFDKARMDKLIDKFNEEYEGPEELK